MRNLFLLLFALPLMTCTHSWKGIPEGVPHYMMCQESNEGPHMLKVPGFKKSFIIVERCNEVDRERVSVAFKVFIAEWERVTKNTHSTSVVKESINKLVVKFSSEKKTANAYTIDGTYGKSFSLSGLTLSPGWVWVKILPGQRLCNTSLAHELVHVALWNLSGKHGDPDHLGKAFKGWEVYHGLIIQETNTLLCELGI